DPGVHNWIDTQGFERGNLTYRVFLGEGSTRFQTQLVKRSELARALPADTAKVSAQERVPQMPEPFDPIPRRYALGVGVSEAGARDCDIAAAFRRSRAGMRRRNWTPR